MKINEKLALVIPLYGDEDQITGYVHSTPISTEVFEANFWLISKTYAAITEGGLNILAGPKVASLVMRDVAKSMGDEAMANAATFLTELRRLSSAIMPKDTGWEPIPYQVAVERRLIEPEDVREVDSAIVFFTVGSQMYPRQVRKDMLDGAAQILGARIQSCNVTELIASLPTSIATDNSGEMKAA